MFFAKNKKRNKKGFRWLPLPRLPRPQFSLAHGARQGISMIGLLLTAMMCALSFLGQAGEAGHSLNNLFIHLLGAAKWAVPIILTLSALGISRDEEDSFDSANVFGLFLFFISLAAWLAMFGPVSGGAMGQMVLKQLLLYIGEWGSGVLLSTLLIVSLLLVLNTSLSKLLGQESVVYKVLALGVGVMASPFYTHHPAGEEVLDEDTPLNPPSKGDLDVVEVKEYENDEEGEDEEQRITSPAPTGAPPSKGDFFTGMTPRLHSPQFHSGQAGQAGVQVDIPLSLLKNKPKKPTSGNIERNQQVIKKTLLDFGIPCSMGEVRVGPTVTQYTLKPQSGIPVSRIKQHSDDLAMNLALHPVRVEAPIPGRPLVGLEVPNQIKVLVTLKEVLASKIFRDRKGNTTLPLGRDVSGKIWTSELAKMPHLLVAGATASGKSIALHSIITSLLYQNNPDDLKLILIDCKQVELTMYNDIPYLIAPVVTENKRAVRALQWCLNEMERRLEVLSEARCQNLDDYNKQKSHGRMPRLVVVVDELGDLLATMRKEAESAIIRLGQKARAAGIHLVLATQRPTVDILSGLIKANLPARIAFSVTSSGNSKTILDFTGAEKLLGAGDMLFINSQLSKPVRIQGAYITKEEIRAVVRYIIKKTGRATYKDDIGEVRTGQMEFEDIDVDDELMAQARELIINSGKASASSLQSRLSIGYPRANRILDILEKQGLVGPSIQNKPREVYN